MSAKIEKLEEREIHLDIDFLDKINERIGLVESKIAELENKVYG